METDKLVEMLARQAGPVARGAVPRRYGAALAAGGAGALLLMAAFLGVRPDLAQAAREPMFWVKLALPLALLAVALLATARLARPGVRVGYAAEAVLVPVGAIWALAAVALHSAAPGERLALVLGDTWTVCPFNIAMLSVPAFAAAFWAMRGLAPTRPAVAGAFSGLLAGAVGAAAYCLHCPEMAPPFLGTWYLLGMAIPALAGAMAGPRLLRW
ncbi:MAG: DUF1109 domain-containing protein [Betaproteobacteria bacterium]|nr:DUF1109 domain-containing protein [Betaproteobacteria bacterium]PWB62312.1 MAG: anti-sigma F factor [Betaproteobacteria bacterium]